MSIEVSHLHFSYDTRPILRDICFKAEYGELLSVLGPNGVGKSTLFRCMLGLLRPSSGTVLLDGTAAAQLDAVALAKKIAYIPQSHDPVFNYTVLDMVLMGTTAQNSLFRAPGAAQRERALQALERLGIANLRDRGYRNLSGGERQLVLIARAIAQQARFLLMDEPSASLDFGNRVRVMQTVRDLTADGYAVIQSTHDPEQAFLYSDKILALHAGRVLAWGPPQLTITSALISQLYGMPIEVCSLQDDRVRACIPVRDPHTECEGL